MSKTDDNVHVYVLQNSENKVKRLVKLVLLFFKQILRDTDIVMLVISLL